MGPEHSHLIKSAAIILGLGLQVSRVIMLIKQLSGHYVPTLSPSIDGNFNFNTSNSVVHDITLMPIYVVYLDTSLLYSESYFLFHLENSTLPAISVIVGEREIQRKSSNFDVQDRLQMICVFVYRCRCFVLFQAMKFGQ